MNTDNASPETVLMELLICATSWQGEARIIGNIRAMDIARAITHIFENKISVDVSKMVAADGITYYVIANCNGREFTLSSYTRENRAEYDAACFNYLINGGDEPDIMEYPD